MWMCALLEINNLHLPIHAIPTEVLADIFTLAWSHRESYALAHVCRRWRAIVLATPAFWVQAIAGDAFGPSQRSQRYINTAVARSAGRTIPHLRLLQIEVGYTLVMRHLSSRIRSLHLDVTDNNQLRRLIETFHAVAWPQLNELRIDGVPARWGLWERNTFDSTIVLPSLRRLQLPAFLFETFVVPSLKAVSLRWPRADFDPLLLASGARGTMEAVLRTLQRCPDLESLHLDEVLTYGPAEDQSLDVVHLPLLRDLRIKMYGNYILTLLSHLDVRPTSQLRGHLHFTDCVLDWLQCPHIVPTSTLSDATALCTTLTIGIDEIRPGGPAVIRCLSTNGSEVLRIKCLHLGESNLRNLVGLLRPITITHLIIALPFSLYRFVHEDPPLHSTLLHALPNLEVLDICGDKPSKCGVVRALALGPDANSEYEHQGADGPELQLLSGGSGGSPWPCPCPSLRRLSIGWTIRCEYAQYVSQSQRKQLHPRTDHPAGVDTYLRQYLGSLHTCLNRTLAVRAVLGARPVETLELYHVAICNHHDRYSHSPPEQGELTEDVLEELEELVRPLRARVEGPVTYKGAIYVGHEYVVEKDTTWRPLGWDWGGSIAMPRESF